MITGVSERKHREEFATPLKNERGAEVRFAGEHTSEDHFATAHGALMSGWREANVIAAART
jgi:monoamine oxidase